MEKCLSSFNPFDKYYEVSGAPEIIAKVLQEYNGEGFDHIQTAKETKSPKFANTSKSSSFIPWVCQYCFFESHPSKPLCVQCGSRPQNGDFNFGPKRCVDLECFAAF